MATLYPLENDSEPGDTLIIPVMRDGKRIAAAPTLEQIREHATRELARLPEMLRRLEKSDDYPVLVSDKLKALASQMDQKNPPVISPSGAVLLRPRPVPAARLRHRPRGLCQ